ncbi:uroporphyrinogen-III synthase [Mobilicoccus pelagius]|uniref:uroporphyrinogen-III C-methyltransferase n=1 Tax=Mobilicoccus pelagius NBRC 104925 TaxID=1089455 RepID=H5US28_9MICO|nr:uroporphyrinogen-III synthase [Mobilicoccus pelagius]GAB48536.1 uroporphyrin-III C-methyltransferase/uroporphyrinogen-III synthase [Mobilicoccus pelagius NBRC 104925]
MTTSRRTSPPAPASGATPTRVAFVGAGPGDHALLTVRAAELLAAADAVVVDDAAAEVLAREYGRPDVTIIETTEGDRGNALTHASWAKLVARAATQVGKDAARAGSGGGLLVRLMTGDPTAFHGLAAELAACHKAGHATEIVPGVSTSAGVAAYAGIPLTSRESGSVHIVDAAASDADWSGGVADSTTVVVLGDAERLADGLEHLAEAGRDGATPVAITENGTTTEQRTTTSTLADAPALLRSGELQPDVALVGATVSLRDEMSWYETKPLFGWRVLVPRTKDQAGPTIERLAEYGARGETVPTISVEPPRTPQQMQRAIKGLVTGRYEWVGFTSVNAVRAVREKLEEIGLDVRAFAGLKIAAVGGVTAEALREMGLEPDLLPTGEQSAKGLLEVWPPYDEVLDPINGVFLPRADIATDTLVAGLQEMGWEVDDVTAYRTVRAAPPAVEIRDAIKQGAFDAVIFTSSSTVRNLVGIAGKPHPTTVVACIGPATAKTAEEHGLTVSVLAEEASSDALVDALAAHGRRLRADSIEAGEDVRRPSERRPAARRKAR